MHYLKRLLEQRIVRFLIAGGSAFVIEYASFLIFVHLGWPLVLSNSVSFCLGLLTSFTLNRLFVFQNNSGVAKQFALYVVMALVNLMISNMLLWVGVNLLHVPLMYTKVIVMMVIAVWNYVIFSNLIFRSKGVSYESSK